MGELSGVTALCPLACLAPAWLGRYWDFWIPSVTSKLAGDVYVTSRRRKSLPEPSQLPRVGTVPGAMGQGVGSGLRA